MDLVQEHNTVALHYSMRMTPVNFILTEWIITVVLSIY